MNYICSMGGHWKHLNCALPSLPVDQCFNRVSLNVALAVTSMQMERDSGEERGEGGKGGR